MRSAIAAVNNLGDIRVLHKRTAVQGALQPEQGAIRIQSPTAEIDRRVNEGQVAKRDEVLFVLAHRRRSTLR